MLWYIGLKWHICMTKFSVILDKVLVSSISANFCRSYAQFWSLENWIYAILCTFNIKCHWFCKSFASSWTYFRNPQFFMQNCLHTLARKLHIIFFIWIMIALWWKDQTVEYWTSIFYDPNKMESNNPLQYLYVCPPSFVLIKYYQFDNPGRFVCFVAYKMFVQ